MLDLLIQNLNLILKRLIQRWLFFGTQHTYNNYPKIYMKRRQFLSLTTSASLFALSMRGANLFAGEATTAKPFKMLFAPRVGMPTFQQMAGKDEIKRMEFFKGQGFRGVEGVVFIQHKKPFSDKQKQRQKLIGEKAKELGLAMGPQSSMNEKDVPTMTANKTLDGKSGKTAIRDMLKRQLETTFGVLENVGGKTFIIGPGALDKELEWDRQYANVVENMAFCADIVGKAGFVMEIEPLNTVSHPGVFCDRAELGARICRDVNMPSCRILYDIFHEQMQVKNLDSLDNPDVWKYIESFHVADAPDRNEPGTGIIDYPKVFKKIWDKGFRGIIGLEHMQSAKTIECEKQIIDRYRSYDALA